MDTKRQADAREIEREVRQSRAVIACRAAQDLQDRAAETRWVSGELVKDARHARAAAHQAPRPAPGE